MLLVLCVDLDDDIGVKGGVETPVVGRDAVERAAVALATEDPEDSDVNVLFEGLHIADRVDDEAVEVAAVTGVEGSEVAANRAVGEELDTVLAGLATGAGVGAGAGALHGHLTDYGIDDTFMHGLSEQLQPGSSALFVLARSISADKVTDELSRFEGKVLRTSLSDTQERKLREALESQADNQAA